MHVGSLRGAGVRRSVLVFAVLLVHSLPEGFAIGSAFASDTEGLGLFVILAIALQNIRGGHQRGHPDATPPASVAASSSGRRSQRARAGPVGALLAYALVEQIEGLLPFSFGFAAGAMLALVAFELAPEAFRRGARTRALAGTAFGAALMLVLAALLGV